MVVHRRQLPVVDPCAGFVPAEGSVRGDGGFCERCQRDVHDVSAMSESQLRTFLVARAGTRVCVAYRVDARGYVRLRPEPPPSPPPTQWPLQAHWMQGTVGALALLLAACAGHLSEAEVPGSACRDAQGYEVECPGWGEAELLSVPEALELDDAEGCPLRPTAEGPEEESTELLVEDPGVTDEALPDEADEALVDVYEIDVDEEGLTRGVVVEVSPATIQPESEPPTGLTLGAMVVPIAESTDGYVPTTHLWQDWRARRAERRAARARWRASRRAGS